MQRSASRPTDPGRRGKFLARAIRRSRWRGGPAGRIYTGKRETLAAGLAAARSRATALESPEDLLALIRSGDATMRQKLKAEIRKRICRISINFGLDGFEAVCDIEFVNGVQRGIILDGERVLLLHVEGRL
jgi:hypothetical protein